MTSFTHIARTGAAYLLAEHLGNPDATLVAGEHYITPVPTQDGALTIRHSGIRLDSLAAVVSCQRALTTLHRAWHVPSGFIRGDLPHHGCDPLGELSVHLVGLDPFL